MIDEVDEFGEKNWFGRKRIGAEGCGNLYNMTSKTLVSFFYDLVSRHLLGNVILKVPWASGPS